MSTPSKVPNPKTNASALLTESSPVFGNVVLLMPIPTGVPRGVNVEF
ncbi:hypothetical protein ACQUEC_04945 [Lactococcus lactis]